MEKAEKDELPNLFVANKSKHLQSTCNVFICAYNLAKLNRPYSDMIHSVTMASRCGADMGLCLHSRMSATDIISVISNEMKKSLCKNIIDRSQKVSIMVDESTSVSNKSVLALYVRTKWPCNTVDQDTSAFSFPLELIELDSRSAQHI